MAVRKNEMERSWSLLCLSQSAWAKTAEICYILLCGCGASTDRFYSTLSELLQRNGKRQIAETHQPATHPMYWIYHSVTRVSGENEENRKRKLRLDVICESEGADPEQGVAKIISILNSGIAQKNAELYSKVRKSVSLNFFPLFDSLGRDCALQLNWWILVTSLLLQQPLFQES